MNSQPVNRRPEDGRPVDFRPVDGRPILLGIDGEPHTAAATRTALDLAARHELSVVAVHVRDPYLKQFHNDIYAQGRREYLEHVDSCLSAIATEADRTFCAAATVAGVDHCVKLLDGDPIEELVREAHRGLYGLVIVGKRPRKGFAAWRSRDLPGKLAAALSGVPLLLVVPEVS